MAARPQQLSPQALRENQESGYPKWQVATLTGKSRVGVAFLFMRNRDNRYRLRTLTGVHTLSRTRWTRIVAAGLAVIITDHLSEARRGVLVELRAGELWVCDPSWLYTSWISIDRMAPIRGEHWQKTLERDHCVPPGAKVEAYTETRTAMRGWAGTIGELQAHVEEMRKAA